MTDAAEILETNINIQSKSPLVNKIYVNSGNPELIRLLSRNLGKILDIGCGAGDNANLISNSSNSEVYGVTYSAAEAEIARSRMKKCWVFDIQSDFPADLNDLKFDCLIFSHVLEHLQDPSAVLARFSRLLHSGGQVLIAVPNVLSWRMRINFLKGNFKYEKEGVLDDTHLRFFTYFTADQYLLAKAKDLNVISKTASGSVPLWLFRRYLFPPSWCHKIDEWGCRNWPNLFGGQILISAVKKS